MSLCVPMSAVTTRLSGGAFALIRFLTDSSMLIATSLTVSESVKGSTSRPLSGCVKSSNIGSIFCVRIIFCYSSVAGLPHVLFYYYQGSGHSSPGLGSIVFFSSVICFIFCSLLQAKGWHSGFLQICSKPLGVWFHRLASLSRSSHCSCCKNPLPTMSSNEVCRR